MDRQIEVYTNPQGEEFLTRATEPLTGSLAPRRFPTARQQWLPDAILDWWTPGRRRAASASAGGCMSGVRSESPPRVPACHGGAALARAWGGGLESLDFQGLDATIRICKYLRGVGVQPASSGSWGSVVWAVDRRGRTAARKFFSELAQQDRAKIQSQFNILAEDGRIPTTERFKKLANRRNWTLWEFKSFQIRFIGTFSKRTSPGEFVVALGIRKKANRHKASDLERAVRILNDHFGKEIET